MYKLSFHLFRALWPIILLASILLFLLDVWGQERWSRTIVSEIIAYGFLVYLFHLNLLTGRAVKLTGKQAKGQTPNRHFWFAYAFPLLMAIATLFLLLPLIESTFPAEALVGNAKIGFAVILSLIFLGILLSTIGTMMPAATVGTSIGFIAALKRARKTFWFVLWRLLVGPALYSLVLMTLLVLLGKLATLPPFPQSFSAITVTNTLFNVGMTFFGIVNSALTASILSMAYVWVEKGHKLEIPQKAPAFTRNSA